MGRGGAGDDEDAGADDGADPERQQMPRAQEPVHRNLAVALFVALHQLVDGLAQHQAGDVHDTLSAQAAPIARGARLVCSRSTGSVKS